MAVLLALLPEPLARSRLERAARLDRAARATHQLSFVPDWKQLRRLAERQDGVLVWVDPYRGGATLELDALASFIHEFPNAPVIPYGDFRSHPARDVVRIAQQGVKEVVTLGADDDPASLCQIMVRALSNTVVVQAMAELGDLIPAALEPVMRLILIETHREVTPSEIAALCHRHPKTLRERLRIAALPSTGRLIRWGRLLHAARLLQGGTRSVDSIALALGFSSGANLRSQLQRCVGVTPRELVMHGGVPFLISRLRKECLQLRRHPTAPEK